MSAPEETPRQLYRQAHGKLKYFGSLPISYGKCGIGAPSIMVIRLVYYSRAIRDMSLQDIQNILKVARENNASLDICGMLSYESKWFLQALEGDRQAVNELFLEIADDARHDDIVIIGYEYIDQPVFKDWRMGYVANSGAIAETLRRFNLDAFDPTVMTHEQATEFLTQLSLGETEDAA